MLKLTFKDLDLIRADLTGANLTGANLYRANLTGANLTGANLTGANLYRANLTGANLTGANLTGADLYRANLTGANLTGADLTGADLTGADLTGADLYRANLYRANLYGENIARIFARIQREIDPYAFMGVELEAGGYKIAAGCRWFTDAEFRAHVASGYPDTDKAFETFDILDFIASRASALGIVASPDKHSGHARRMRFTIDHEGRAVSATVFTYDGTPVDGYTEIGAVTGLDYLVNHPGTEIDMVMNPTPI